MGFTGSEIHDEAINACQKFKLLFNKFGLCHNMINSSTSYDEDKVNELGK